MAVHELLNQVSTSVGRTSLTYSKAFVLKKLPSTATLQSDVFERVGWLAETQAFAWCLMNADVCDGFAVT
jgi:hypothetical protein